MKKLTRNNASKLQCLIIKAKGGHKLTPRQQHQLKNLVVSIRKRSHNSGEVKGFDHILTMIALAANIDQSTPIDDVANEVLNGLEIAALTYPAVRVWGKCCGFSARDFAAKPNDLEKYSEIYINIDADNMQPPSEVYGAVDLVESISKTKVPVKIFIAANELTLTQKWVNYIDSIGASHVKEWRCDYEISGKTKNAADLLLIKRSVGVDCAQHKKPLIIVATHDKPLLNTIRRRCKSNVVQYIHAGFKQIKVVD